MTASSSCVPGPQFVPSLLHGKQGQPLRRPHVLSVEGKARIERLELPRLRAGETGEDAAALLVELTGRRGLFAHENNNRLKFFSHAQAANS